MKCKLEMYRTFRYDVTVSSDSFENAERIAAEMIKIGKVSPSNPNVEPALLDCYIFSSKEENEE